MLLRIAVCSMFVIAASTTAYSQNDPCDAFYHGANHRFAGRWDEAIAELTKAIDLKCPELGQAYYLRGEARWGKKDYDGAWADATKAIPLLEEPGSGHRLRGRVAFAKGDYKAALPEFSKAIELDPSDGSAVMRRAETREKLGDLDGAIADYTRLIEIDGKDAAESHIARAHIYLAKGDKIKAFADFDKAIAMVPNDPLLFVLRGNAHYSLKDYKAAVADLKKALSISPQNVDAHHYLGHVYHDQQLYADAVASFSSAIKAAPERAGFYLDRGLVYRDLMDLDRARADVIKASQIDPANAEIRISAAWIALLKKNFWDAEGEASGVISRHGMKGNAPYAAIVEYLALRMRGDSADAAAQLKLRIKASEPGAWTDSLLKFLDGQLTATRLLAAADSDAKKTEGRSIIGIKALIDGQPAIAKTHLDWINANGTKQSFEYSFFRLLSGSGTSPAAEAFFAQGNDHFNEGRKTEAIASYTKAIAADPKRPEYLLARAKANISLRKPVLARQDIDRSLQVGATYDAYALSANMHIEAGRYAQAVTDLEAGSKHLKGSQDAAAVFNHHAALAGVNELLGNAAGVKSNLAAAEQAMGDVAFTVYDYALADKSSGQFGLALAKFSAAIADKPENIEFLSERGLVWIELGKLKEALDDFDNALRIAPKKIYVQVNRGETLRLMKRYAEAVDAVDIALDFLPADDLLRPRAHEIRAAANCALGNKIEAGMDEVESIRLGGTIKAPCR